MRLLHDARRMTTLLAAMLLAASAAHAQPGTAAATGRVTAHAVFDSTFHRTRRVWVYTPAGYAPARGPYPLLVMFDATDYLGPIPLPRILDSLVARGAIPPMVALLVDDSSGAVRTGELANQPRFAAMLGGQLLPWLRRGYAVTADPHRIIVSGSSAGGLAAAYLALERPELFGNVLSQSGAFWRGAAGSNGAPFEWLTSRVASLPRGDVHLLLDVGALETQRVLGGTGPVFIEANRRLRDALVAKGYPVLYTEVEGGRHMPESWGPRLAPDLVALTAFWRAEPRAKR